MPRYLHTSLVLAFGVVGLGCSAVVDSGRVQCETDADCTERGAEFASSVCVESVCQAQTAWSCTNHAAVSASSITPVGLEFSLMDAVSQKPIQGVKSSLCGKLDLQCSSPSATVLSNSDGVVHFDIAPLFDGFIQITHDGYGPSMLFIPPTAESLSLGVIPLASTEAATLLGLQLGKTVDLNKGRVLVTAMGCDRETAAGVTITGQNMGDDASGFYAIGGLPTFDATGTDESGFAGFFNVAPGSIILNATLEDGTQVGRVSMVIREGYQSIRRIQPWTD